MCRVTGESSDVPSVTINRFSLQCPYAATKLNACGPAGSSFVETMKRCTFWRDTAKEIEHLKKEASEIYDKLQGILSVAILRH